MSTRLIELVERLPGHTVVLVGDLMMDRYLFGNAERVSPEAPVPVLHYQNEELRLGGAANVAANLATLGAQTRVVGVVGEDDNGRHIRRMLSEIGCDGAGVITAPRPTTCKMRLVGSAQHRHPQQMLRMDFEDPSPIDADTAAQLVARAVAAMEGAAVVCIEDYNKGIITAEVCRQIMAAARQRGLAVIVDPARISDYGRYRGATALKLNRSEAETAAGLAAVRPEDYPRLAERLLEQLDLEALILTLDKSGAYLALRQGQRHLLQGKPRQVFDVTGAGDMVLAALATARAAGGTWEESVAVANVAGGLEVEKFGVVPVTRDEILRELLSEVHLHLGKQRTLERLMPELQRHRASGKRIVFTNGCFDLIHLGHVKYFQFAKAQGDLLVVGINTDRSIRRLKGDKRPIIAEDDRISVLEELESIDYLVRFDEDTPLRLIDAIRPDVLVKGADYAKEQVVGWDVVEGYGGRVALAPLIDGRSTSGVIQRILKAYGE
jgi:D-beta-D-heptose 7-phosphate kinase/D-beta-D-heptose 1-phosphate adenosyltransferase